MRVFVTGGAGFIGSHVCEKLLQLGHEVIIFDNMSTGHNQIAGATLVSGDIRNLEEITDAMQGCTHVAHLAAFSSVPASVANPNLSAAINLQGTLNVLHSAEKLGIQRIVFSSTAAINLQGTLNVLHAAEKLGIQRIVFSSTAAIYGDASQMPVTEETVANCQSPYAEDKLAAEVAILNSEIEAISLRYFNVHGPRQDPNGAYAAVIPAFIHKLVQCEPPIIYGSGEATRDFVTVDDVASANILALTTQSESAVNQVYNVASGTSISISKLFNTIRDLLAEKNSEIGLVEPSIQPIRDGDILHSSASIEKARTLLGFNPETDPHHALAATVEAYWAQHD